MNAKIFFFAPLLFVSSCGLINEKHEEVWFVEWRLLDAGDSAPIVKSGITCRLHILPASGGFAKDTFNFPVDSSGYIFNVMYTEYRGDFLNKNPRLQIQLYDSANRYLDTSFLWSFLDFRDQKFDALHYDHENQYMLYDSNTVYRDVSKKSIIISYPRP
jgi:hypothetical protein